MMKTKYILLPLLTVALYACDNSSDYFYGVNSAPEIEFSSDRVSDTIQVFRDSVKARDSLYLFNYKIKDDQVTAPELYFDESTGKNDAVTINQNQVTLHFSETGKRTLAFYTKDDFGVIYRKDADITVFVNLPPVPVFKLIDDNSPISSLERKLDLSGSYDKDKKYGGKVKEYSFQIDNQKEVITTKPYINHIFEMSGQYVIKVKVMDDDNKWSETLTKTIAVTN